MNADGFLDECRREWKRLGVPAEVAEEMAAELHADLADAAADGVPAAELLGAGAHDARGFAASWATERGVVPAARRRRRVPVVLGAVLAAAALGIGLFAARSTSQQVRPATSTSQTVVLHPVGSALAQLVAVHELSRLQLQLAEHHR